MANKIKELVNDWQSKGFLDKAIFVAAFALIAVVLAFSGYYYFDRYVNIGDQSPVQLSIASLEDSVRDDPQDVDVRINLALTYLDANRFKEARDQSLQVLENFPERDEPLFIYGLASFKMNDYVSAVEYLKQFTDLRKESPTAALDTYLQTALYFLGDAYLELDLPNEAAEALELALHLNSMDADAYFKVGVAYAQADQHEKAVANYLRATDFVPDFLEAFQMMIQSYAALEDPGMVAFARGMEALTLGDLETAETHLKAAVEDYPEFARAYIGLAMVYEQRTNYQQALSNIEIALQLEPNNFMANNVLGRINFVLGEEAPAP
jgi:tetratricopeptide (TPR) repeat protein